MNLSGVRVKQYVRDPINFSGRYDNKVWYDNEMTGEGKMICEKYNQL